MRKDKSPQAVAGLASLVDQAVAFHQRGELAQAERLYRSILQKSPGAFTALHFLGVIEAQKRNYAEAVRLIRRAIKLNPNSAEAHSNLGVALQDLGRHDEALASYQRALNARPDYAEAINNCGNALIAVGRPAEAIKYLKRVLDLNPNYAAAYSNQGVALHDLGQHDEALASFEHALALQPDDAEVLTHMGNVFLDLGGKEDALTFYERALAIVPTYPEALFNRGAVLLDLKRHENAAGAFERLLAIKPDCDFAKGYLLLAQLHCCAWDDYEKRRGSVASDVAAGKRAAVPFAFLPLSGAPGEQLRCAQNYGRSLFATPPESLWKGEKYNHDKIRVAYLSADFHDHATAHLTAGLFETHDKTRFSTTGISFGPPAADGMRQRLTAAFDRFVDVRDKTDRDTALILRELEIDIAVDLKGYTADNRARILMHRPAPLQVNYLGYPGTMGIEAIDYILADRTVIPPDHQRHYAEKVVSLPDTYQVNDSRRRAAGPVPARAALGLPESGFVFCCFNEPYKLTPEVFDIWLRLLRQVNGSVLWLLEGNATALHNLRHRAAAAGVAPDRLIFAARAPQEDHIARLGAADLFLDTLPYNAHTTASDALWAGLPVLTCLGGSFAGRVAASLLRAIGLPELIAASLPDYEALALNFASDPARLTAIRATLAENRHRAPLFNTERFCRHVESAYETMWRRHQDGLPPGNFAVEAQA